VVLGPDELADIEGDAEAIYRELGFDPSSPPSMAALCRAATGHSPKFVGQPQEARLVGDQVFLRRGVLAARATWLVGHELAERRLRHLRYRGSDIEARCDALGAALVAPRPAFRAAIRELGHAVYALAESFNTTQSVALLRIGEVTGRPVVLLRWPDPIVRGGPYEWPSTSELVRTLRERRPEVHPVRIVDERGKWGLMAVG
jgi:hypothetical protein